MQRSSLAFMAALLAPAGVASAQTATPLVSAGDTPIPTLVDVTTNQVAAVSKVLSFSVTPGGGFIVNLGYSYQDDVEIAPGVFIQDTVLRNVYYGDFGSGAGLILEDDFSIGTATRRSLGPPALNDAGDLAYVSRSDENISLVGTTEEAIFVNGTKLAQVGETVPAGFGFPSGAVMYQDSGRIVRLLDNGDAVIGTSATGVSGVAVQGTGPNAGETGTAIEEAIAFYDASSGTLTRLVGSGDTVTNRLGADPTISLDAIDVTGGGSAELGGIGSFAVSSDASHRAFTFDADERENHPGDPTADRTTLVYDGFVAQFVDRSNVQRGLIAPTRVGGDGVSTIESISNVNLSDGGFWAANADLGSVANDDVVLVNGGVAVSEGDTVPIASGLGGGTHTIGLINELSLNADGDLVFFSNDAVILNGEVVVLEGVTGVDGGGTITNLFQNVELSDRDTNGDVTLLINGRTNFVPNEVLYSITVTPRALVAGDFDYDRNAGLAPGLVGDVDDIDILTSFFDVNGFDSDGFDLTGDHLVDDADLTELVEVIMGTAFGDANLDGSVNVVDLDILATNFSLTGGWGDGDFNGDGVIDILDLGRLATSFGFTAAQVTDLAAAFNAGDVEGGLAIPAVPEPATLALIGFAAAAVGRRSRG